ncbi:translation elongation factor Ts [candidate division KSB1 bacterium]|nr:translation elongation factor Ts [candidate division KSB1 bacterium]
MTDISAAKVKELRDKIGVGMMDCKSALVEADGDIDKAIDILRTKGRTKADTRAGKSAKEGLIESYIHMGSKLGVLLEINCETDFVAKTDDFKKLAKELSMQIAASNPLVVQREDLDSGEIEHELEIYRNQARNENKPDKLIDKIANGKIEKYYKEVCLLEQAYIKDSSLTVKDLVTDVKAKLGENIRVSRFTRFRIGE